MERKSKILSHHTASLAAGSSLLEQYTSPFRFLSDQQLKGSKYGARGATAVKMARNLECPPISHEIVCQLDGDQPSQITKYLNEEGYKHSLAGSFRFGTLSIYRGEENSVKNNGRFSDENEGLQQHQFKSRTGYSKSFKAGNIQISNTNFSGFDNDVAVEFIANAYCACASIGGFSSERVAALRENGNSDLTHYVTYDLARLKAAIDQSMRLESTFQNCSIIGRPIIYGIKDLRWEIEEYFDSETHRDPLAIFMGLAFVKDQIRFEHESEYRLLIVDLDHLGQLDESKKHKNFDHSGIAGSIISSGTV